MRLILTDIDNTILPWGQTEVSDRMRAAFHAALDAGHVVGVASGRSHSWLPRFFGGDDACCATAVATNGQEIYCRGELVCEKALPAEALEAMRRVVHAWPHAGMLCFEGSTPLLVEGSVEELAPIFPGYAKTGVPSTDIPATSVIKANVFVPGDVTEQRRLAEAIMAEVPALDVDLARPSFSNVMPHGWNKGTAVEFLRDRLGVAPDDVFVFGDADNDLPMLRAIKNSVAVANATPEAAAAARWHIGDVRDDAAAQAIEALAREEFPFDR